MRAVVAATAFAGVVLFSLVLWAAAAPPDVGVEIKGYDPAEGEKRRQELLGLGQEFQKLLLDHADLREKWAGDFARAQLKLEKCALLLERYFPGTARDDHFKKELDAGRVIIRALAGGKNSPPPRTGLIELAYLSDIDGSAQPYYLYVPEKLDLAKPAPLLLFLHGYVGDLDKVNWFDQTVPESAKKMAEKLGGVLLSPFARSNTDFQGIGERDVMKTIELAKRDYEIDAGRVYLTGASMGASGVWTIGAHTPDAFAAIVPASGRTDYNLWQKVDRGVLAQYKQLIVDRDFAITLQPNFRNLPVWAFHGEEDMLVDPEQSRRMIAALSGLKFEALYEEFPKGDHWTCFNAYDSEKLAAWLGTKKLASRPDHVSYRTYHPRFNRAYWVTIDDFMEFGKPAEIEAKVESAWLISVRAENVARFTLNVATAFFLQQDLQVRLPDGRLIKPTANKDGLATFTPIQIGEAPAGDLRKRGEVSGPVYEAYQRPFCMVFGTLGDAGAAEQTKIDAGKAALEWYDFAAGVPRVKRDTSVTDEDIQKYNLILFGTPKTNRMIQRIADRLPIGIDEGKFTVGGKTYEGGKLGLAMTYPNPLNRERMVVIYSGTPWGAALSKNHKLDLLPDYIVFDDTIAPVSSTNNFKAAGFFDMGWKLDAKLMWFGPEKAPVKK
jgi:predicted esterase